jgi:hypothetical protein
MDNDINTLAAAYLVRQAIDAQDFIAAIFDGGCQ